MTIRYALSCGLLCTASLLATTAPQPASAQDSVTYDFHIPAQSMDATLRGIARISGIEILYRPGDLSTLIAPAITGQMRAADALDKAIDGSPLRIERSDGSLYIRRISSRGGEGKEGDGPGNAIVVTGSRISGAPIASTVITLTADEMRDAGQYRLGDVMRALPQNFGGGQNPTVVDGSNRASDQNVNSSTGVNLRGMGADATLTLLNGKRLAYDSTVQSIDISAIPMGAVERVEILTDGASAVYGSDAVAGVVNILLKPSFEGLETSIRLGSTSDGGNFQQQYMAVGGQKWNDGGFLIAAEYDRNSAVLGRQRSVTNPSPGSSTLFPEQRHVGMLVSANQAVTDSIKIDLDAMFNKRRSFFGSALSSDGDYSYFGIANGSDLKSFSIAPRVSWAVAGDWVLSALGVYGEDNTQNVSAYSEVGELIDTAYSRFDNNLVQAELSATGTILSLPGGPLKMAFGGGYRRNAMASTLRVVDGSTSRVTNAYERARSSTYLYAETTLPIIGADNAVAGIHRLTATAALRYERYADIDKIATPKLGLVYEPVAGMAFKASWGKSFKAPTFRQQFLYQRATLNLPGYYGATNLPAGSTVLTLSGGNPDLKPERAETWSLGVTLDPAFLPALHVEASYFHTDYRDRVVVPLASRAGALTNPIYASYLITNPTVDQVNAAIASADIALQNSAGVAFDPASVRVILDNRNQNATRQLIKGVDLSLAYRIETSRLGTIELSGLVTYLESDQQLLPGQSAVQLAGSIFNPPHWRGRGGAVWHLPGLSLAAYANRIGGVDDARYTHFVRIEGMTTVDLNIRLEPQAPALDGLSLAVGVQNLFNVKPDRIRPAANYMVPYDSTNYSALGRSFGITLEKRW